MEEVQPVVLPHGKSQMGNVQSLFITGNGNDVAILNDRAQQPRVQQRRLGNIADSKKTGVAVIASGTAIAILFAWCVISFGGVTEYIYWNF